MTLEIVGRRAMGGLVNWITGETDYTIFVPPSSKARMVSHEWGLLVTDETFETIFTSFMTKFRQVDLSEAEA